MTRAFKNKKLMRENSRLEFAQEKESIRRHEDYVKDLKEVEKRQKQAVVMSYKQELER